MALLVNDLAKRALFVKNAVQLLDSNPPSRQIFRIIRTRANKIERERLECLANELLPDDVLAALGVPPSAGNGFSMTGW